MPNSSSNPATAVASAAREVAPHFPAHSPVHSPPRRLGPVQETMLLSLWARARESVRAEPIVDDPAAVRMLAAIDHDFSQYDHAWKTQVGVAVRGRFMDETVRVFVQRHPAATIVNLGAGLDTRFERVDNGRIRWFDLDVADAIALRRQWISESSRRTFITGSAFDPDWIETVRGAGPGPVLVIAEGVLMFFPPTQVQDLLARLSSAFAGGAMLLDCIGPWMVHLPWLHDSITRTRARFLWSVRRPRALTRGLPGVEVREWRSMLDETPRRWRWMRRLRWIPGFRQQFVVAHLGFGARQAQSEDSSLAGAAGAVVDGVSASEAYASSVAAASSVADESSL